MKKIVALAMLWMASGALHKAAADPGPESRRITVQPFYKLSVAANITVILFESSDVHTVVIKGRRRYTNRVALLQKDGKLTITSGYFADMQESVTVYVPVNKLQSLEVNDQAWVRSQTVLNSAQLELRSDGLSDVQLITNGRIEISKGDHYTYVRRIRIHDPATRLSLPVFY